MNAKLIARVAAKTAAILSIAGGVALMPFVTGFGVVLIVIAIAIGVAVYRESTKAVYR